MSEISLSHSFAVSACEYGLKTAIRFLRQGKVEIELTYGELDDDARLLACFLADRGIMAGDRVVFFLMKSVFTVVAHLAVQKLGAIAVHLNPGFKSSEMDYLLGNVDAALVFVGPNQQDLVAEVAPDLNVLAVDTNRAYREIDFFRSATGELPEIELAPSDPGLIVYTSGTTGNPKGAILTQQNLVHDARNVIRIWEISDKDVLCHALPLFHVHGLCFALHTALMAGAEVLLLDAFDPENVLDVLGDSEVGATVFMAVPAMYAKLMSVPKAQKSDYSHVRLWTSGSAPLLVKDFERIKLTFGKEPVEREGMSETGMNFSNPLHGNRIPGSIGLPLPDLEVRIVDPGSLEDVPPGEEGEIWLKGPAVTPGYWRKPKETEETFEDGWFRTGDLGKVNADGYYYLTDRIKHIIISGSENISPKEIETVINRFDGVRESSVVGIVDEKWGEKVVAAIVPKPGAVPEPAGIKAHCKTHLHPWKCPKAVVLVDELPKNTMGKVLKEEVKQLFSD